ncbi:group II intron reverse transcriptase/maturase [Rhodopirellula sp. SWK7]|uniref:group II intron reverse transcriptase/maturase n=1 Tax=Rhodopirellula sp. SWK7 TaxID=595460 RepID=UPI0002BF1E41|nr:group II intron reverse transcriptase/maturase [Rhodopirellula sp. SWK7]EMI41568.1 reverse transcriptase/maturase [Rhodopirellula sp. SWK7]
MDNSKRARSEKSRTLPRDRAYVAPADLQHALERIRQAACRDKELRFTSLWHHVYNVDRLRKAYFKLKRKAAAGVDDVTWEQYGEELEDNLHDLSQRLQRGAYRAKPVRRVYIPKADGRQRALGVTALEDKIVQRSTVEVLNTIYETDFLGFSYGFRPGRNPHHALDAICVAMTRRKVNWVLDADISGFFDAIDREWLVKFLEHRIADPRVIRHIKKWLNAGVMEDGNRIELEAGTPQGGSVSPLLANVYLHYVFDLWADQWRRRHARGDVVIVRFADDSVLGFEHRSDAEQFHNDLRDRFSKFCLELHPDKTRLIEFGRFAARNRKRRGEGKPESFDFLGFTHTCDRSRNGRFVVLRQTIGKRMRAKLAEIKCELRKRLHHSVPSVGQWLRSVVQGHFQYYAVPRNQRKLNAFKYQVYRLWLQSLRRRSQRHRITGERMNRLAAKWLPPVRTLHPYPEQRLRVTS